MNSHEMVYLNWPGVYEIKERLHRKLVTSANQIYVYTFTLAYLIKDSKVRSPSIDDSKNILMFSESSPTICFDIKQLR